MALAGTTTEKDGRDSAKEDLDIEPERPLVDILETVSYTHLTLPTKRIV